MNHRPEKKAEEVDQHHPGATRTEAVVGGGLENDVAPAADYLDAAERLVEIAPPAAAASAATAVSSSSDSSLSDDDTDDDNEKPQWVSSSVLNSGGDAAGVNKTSASRGATSVVDATVTPQGHLPNDAPAPGTWRKKRRGAISLAAGSDALLLMDMFQVDATTQVAAKSGEELLLQLLLNLSISALERHAIEDVKVSSSRVREAQVYTTSSIHE